MPRRIRLMQIPQQQLKDALMQLTPSGIQAYAQEGITLTSDETVQLSSHDILTTTSAGNTALTVPKT